jgi:hypothetical protein
MLLVLLVGQEVDDVLEEISQGPRKERKRPRWRREDMTKTITCQGRREISLAGALRYLMCIR